MIDSPFQIFNQFKNNLHISLIIKEDNITNDLQIADILKVPDICSLWQVHGNKTINVNSPTSRTQQADGMITNKSNLVLTIRTADCQPLVIYSPDTNTLGVLHVGWRGLIAGAIPEFFKLFNSKNTYVGIGPSLCQKCAGFSDPKNELPGIDSKFIDENNCVDLMGVADKQLINLGISKDHIERNFECTCCNPEKYWTYRGGDRGEVKAGHTNVLACYLK